MNVLYALLWAPVSFLLHNVIHEGAHAIVAFVGGGRVTEFWPFPSKKTGRFTWAHVGVAGVPSKYTLWLYAAPVVAEVLWLIGATVGFVLADGPLRWILLVEMISANVDIVNWYRKLFQDEPDLASDAIRARTRLGGEDAVMKRLVGVHLAILVAQLYLVLKTFE